MKIPAFIIVLYALCASFAPVTGGDLEVEINGFRNNNGFVLVSLFKGESGFPGSSDKAMIKEKGMVTNGKCLLAFKALPPGTYAISVLHDENKNLKMDTKMLVLPREGFGFSRNASGTFGPPKFSKASFDHSGEQHIVIGIKYF